MGFVTGGLKWLAILFGFFWLIYLAVLWFKQSRITDTTKAMFLGYFIGCICMISNLQEYVHWLRKIPKGIVEVLALDFILIFCALPLIAEKFIKHKKKIFEF
jgi:hypothetical protein